MTNTNVRKSFSTLECLNIYAFLNQFTANSEKMDCLPLKFKWNLTKNMKKLAPISQEYEEFRNSSLSSLQSSWFDEEHSVEIMQPKIGADGKPEVDETGAEVTEAARKIKEEYMDDYRAAVDELNSKLNEIVMEQNEMELSCVDFDEFVESLPDDTKLDIQDLTMLSFQDMVTSTITDTNNEAE